MREILGMKCDEKFGKIKSVHFTNFPTQKMSKLENKQAVHQNKVTQYQNGCTQFARFISSQN